MRIILRILFSLQLKIVAIGCVPSLKVHNYMKFIFVQSIALRLLNLIIDY